LESCWTHIEEGISDEDLVVLARDLYIQRCVDVAKAGRLLTHDGIRVAAHPFEEHFRHAFFTAASRDRYGIAKDVVDDRRVARVGWIAPVIGGLVEGTKCYQIREFWRKPPPEKRLYVVRRERYVVWLIRNPKGFYFKTAYVTGYGDIDRYIERQRLIWER
jgi:hypothetical protein